MKLAMISVAGACLALLSATAAQAQTDSSLEQTYASMCAGKPEPETEACAALKKALVAKLSGGTGLAGAGAAPPPSRQQVLSSAGALSSEEMRRRWGMYANMAGKSYLSKDGTIGVTVRILQDYKWKVPGEILEVTTQAVKKNGTPDPDGGSPTKTIMRWDRALGGIVTDGWDQVARPLPDGSFGHEAGQPTKHGTFRSRSWLDANGSHVTKTDRLKNGVWKEYHRTVMTETTRQAMAQRASGGGGGFMDALGMGLGAAILTGNVETAVSAAAQTAAGANAYDVMSGMADQAQQQAAQSKVELDQTIANALAQSSSGAPLPVSGDSTTGVNVLAGSSASSGTAASAPTGTKMYGWCYGFQPGSGQKVALSSRVGSTDKFYRGVTTDNMSENWHARMQREFTAAIAGGAEAPICLTQPDPKDFGYVRDAVYANEVIEVDWAPN